MSDFMVGPALGGEQDHLGSDDHEIWQRIFSGAMVQLAGLLPRQSDPVWALPWHRRRLLLGATKMPGGQAQRKHTLVYLRKGAL
ncbi:MAG: hypothetical protein AAB113_02305, partial [Candidatus Eisenbacteria bacterium]